MRKLSKLTQELALALEVASRAQAWSNPSPFQDKINELLVRAGRKPVTHLTPLAPDRLAVGGLGDIPLQSSENAEVPSAKHGGR